MTPIPTFIIGPVLFGHDESMEFDLDEQLAAEAPEDPQCTTPLNTRVIFAKFNDQLNVTLTNFCVSVASTCVRCGEDCVVEIMEKKVEHFIDLRLGDVDELVQITHKSGEVDISELIRVVIWEHMPPLVYCKIDCQGFCPQCQTNWNRGTCEHQISPSSTGE